MSVRPSGAFARAFPFHLHWSPQQIADAVPARLHELDLFAGLDGGGAAAPRRPRDPHRGYAGRPGLPAAFRIHG